MTKQDGFWGPLTTVEWVLRRMTPSQKDEFVRDVLLAYLDEGPRPDIHWKVLRRTRRQWPSLIAPIEKHMRSRRDFR